MLDLTKLFSNSRDLGFVTDLRGAVLGATQGAERALGYPPAELVGLDLCGLDEAGELKRFLDATPLRSRMNLGFHLRTRSGEVLTVGALATSLRDDSGAPVGWFIAGQDLRGAVGESRGSQPILDALLDSIGASLWSFDRNGTVITWGRACEPAFGLSRGEAEGKLSVVRLFPSPDDFRRVVEAVDRTGQYSGEIALLGRDGVARLNQLSITPLVSSGQSLGYTCVSVDIAERKRVEELQRAYFEQAGEAIVVVDLSTLRVVDVNDQACRIYGYSHEEFLRLDTTHLRPAGAKVSDGEIAGLLQRVGCYVSDAESGWRKDGSSFPAAINIRLISVGGKHFTVGVVRDLTEQRKAEEFQRVLFEQAGEAIVVVDLGTRRILDANARACELHGYPRDEFLGLRIDDIVSPDAQTQAQVPVVARTLREQGRYEGRRLHRRKDGSLFSCSLNLKTLTIGGLTLVIGVHRDLTEQLQAEEFHRVLFEQAGEAIVVVEHSTRTILDANDKAAELHGYTRAEFLGLRVEDYVAAPAQGDVPEIARALEERGRYEGRQFHRRKDGSLFPCSLNLKTVMIGGRTRVIGVHRDLTEELKADEFFRVLFEKASDAVYLVSDEELQVVAANEAACRLLGYPHEEFLRLRVVDLVPPPYRSRISEFHESVRKGPGYRRDRRVLFRKDGTMVATDHAVARVEISGKPYYIASCRDLTEQERAARELEEAKAFLEHLQENASDGLALLDENGVYVSVNKKFLEWNGARREEILGTTWMSRTAADRMAAYREVWDRQMRGERISMRTTMGGTKGPPVIVDVSSSMILRGERRFIFAIIRDVTDQVKAEDELRRSREDLERHVAERTAQLRESEEKFRGAFAQGGIGMALGRPDGGFLQVNRSFCEMLGYDEKSLLARTAQEITHPEDRERGADHFRAMLLGGPSSARLEKRYVHRSGRIVWADLSTTLVRDAAGAPLYFVTSIQDITERKRAEEELRLSEARFRSITEATPLPVTITRPDGEILYVNEATSRLFRLGPEGTAGRKAGDFYADPAERDVMREKLLRDGGVEGYEIRFRRPDGTLFWAVVNLKILTFDGAPAILGSFLDIDERKRAEELLRKAHEELERRVVERTAELARANTLLQEEIAERKRAENTLRLILEGTAAVTGGSFFRSLARHLASVLDVRYAMVVQGVGGPARRARTIAFWTGSDFSPPVEYDLRSTPCDDVVAGEACSYAHDVQRLFPECAMLGDLGVESYLGVPMIDSSGTVVGHLVLMDVRPVTDEELKLSVLKIFASRGGVELERQLAEDALRESEERWRSLVANAPDFILTVNKDGLIQSINRTVPGLRPEDTLGRHCFEFMHPDARPQVQEALDKVFIEGRSHHYETRAIGANGTMAWYDTRVGPIKIGDQVVGATFIATDVTERRNADQALRESEERWRALVANAPDSITTVDREGRIQSINRVVPGFRMEDVVGRLAFDFVSPDVVGQVRTALESVFREGKSISYETPSPGPHGTVAWYSSRVGPVVLDGRVVAATIISTDVTERRNAELRQKVQHEVTQILAEAESVEEAVPRLLNRVCEGLDWQLGILWKADVAANLLRFVDAWQDPGVSTGEFLETSRASVFPPGIGLPGRVWKEHATYWISDVQEDSNFPRLPSAARSGVHAAFAAPVEGPQRTFGVIEFFSREKRDRDEALLRVASTLGSQLGQFIERKQAEADLRFQKSLLESQSEAAIDGILVVSREGVMTSFNRRFCQMWEISDEVLLSKTDERALQSVLDKLVDPKEFLDRVRHLYEHPNEESRDEIHLKDGRAFDRYSAPVKGGDGELYGRVWYFRDVTGRKHTEENLRRAAAETRQMYENLKEAQAQLIRSEKLASIGMLVSGVAHEINNPLNVMYGNLQLLAEVSDVLLPLSVEGARSKKVRGTVARVAKFRGMIRDALKAARHAREIVQDFRNFARDTRTAELVDLNECLEEAVTLIQRELRPGIRVVRKLGRIPQVRCLRGQMSQVFLNLLKNAGEAIERKGTVTLRTQQKNGHVVVEVADTGRGMAEDVRRKLFEPFFTTKPVGKGLGLGLSISAMIVHNHSGNITVQSRPGKGSVFRVELPLLL